MSSTPGGWSALMTSYEFKFTPVVLWVVNVFLLKHLDRICVPTKTANNTMNKQSTNNPNIVIFCKVTVSFCESLFPRDIRFPVLVGKVSPTATFAVLVVVLVRDVATSSASVVLISSPVVVVIFVVVSIVVVIFVVVSVVVGRTQPKDG